MNNHHLWQGVFQFIGLPDGEAAMPIGTNWYSSSIFMFALASYLQQKSSNIKVKQIIEQNKF